jgi:hypothetical protein
MAYAFIGDIHSHAQNLRRILELIQQEGDYTLVFLGDIFDYNASDPEDSSRPLEVFEIIRNLENKVVLTSNHQDKLLRYLRGNTVKLNNSGLRDTIKRMSLQDISSPFAVELAEWLSQGLYYYIVGCNGIEYRLAHAYHSGRLKNNVITSRGKQGCLYGPVETTVVDGKNITTRLKWWESSINTGFIRVAGHYHEVFMSDKSLILDGGCGTADDGHLVAYLTDKRKIISTAGRLKAIQAAPQSYQFYPEAEILLTENVPQLTV